MTMSSPADLTPKHVRAARALLAWSQQELAKKAGVATSTVADFERGHRTPVANNAQAIRSALETAGVTFLATGAVIGPQIPNLSASGAPAAPVRWITAQDLQVWADQLDGVAGLPRLVSHLIRATHGAAAHLRFPSDEGVRHPGWDGQSVVETASAYVPAGPAGWEIGAQASKIAAKASADYDKRTAAPAPLDPATSTYIFVTPRHWPQKDEWAAVRRAQGPWRDVRVYDGDDLVHWIELNPAVGQQLAAHLGKRPPGVRGLAEVWEEWSLATQWPLTEELVLSDRDEDAAEVLRWLRGEPSVHAIQTTTAEEGAAFFYAVLHMLPDDVAGQYLDRCLLLTDAAAARDLSKAPGPLILVLTEPEPGLARSLAAQGHFVLQTYDDHGAAHGEVRALARPSRDGVARALIEAGLPEPRARALARDSGRNLAILRRLMPSAPGRLPAWAQDPPRALLAALLAGGWDDESASDMTRLSILAGQPHDQALSVLARYVGDFDSPLRKIGSTWRVASPPDAWMLLAPYLTSADLDRFEAAAIAVLGSSDPRFGLSAEERWSAPLKGVAPEFSGMIRHGVGEVLILLALWGDQARAASGAGRRAEAIVRRLLDQADAQRWWSLSRLFRLLSEASPTAFLDAVETSLDQDDPPIAALFGEDDDGLFGGEHLSDLLWALEALAWSPDFMPRVAELLTRLDAIDPGGRYGNRPSASLKLIFLLWAPQTHVPADKRLAVLDRLRRVQGPSAWKLMLDVLPTGHDSFSPSSGPRWRDFSVDKAEPVTFPLIARGAAAISERLVQDAGADVPRWLSLLERLGDLAPSADGAIARLAAIEPDLVGAGEREALWSGLRKLLHHHRQFPGVEWALPDDVLDRLQALYGRFTPSGVAGVAWLFAQDAGLPDPVEGWEGHERQLEEARRDAVAALFAHRGLTGVLDLADQVELPGQVGRALVAAGLEDDDLDRVLEAAVRSDHARARDLGHGLVFTLFRVRGQAWAQDLIARAQAQGWGQEAVLTILLALPQGAWVWAEATKAGSAIDVAYWERTPIFWLDDQASDIVEAVQKLIAVRRARAAVHLAGRDKQGHIPPAVLVQLLQAAAQQPPPDSEHANDGVMFQHHLAGILTRLDHAPEISQDQLVELEWQYLPLLERSKRPVRALLKVLAEQPEQFVELLKIVFRPQEDSGVEEPEADRSDRARAIAKQAYRLLDLWDHIPGTDETGHIDAVVLEGWITQARRLAKAVGREKIADIKIGRMLSASPVGADGAWPAEPVRQVLDLFRSPDMLNGFAIGKQNRRGVTTRMPGDGGELERGEARKYRAWAEAIGFDYPHTAKALSSIAESYDWHAEREDQSAARLDWEG
jgi:transcriptional regulator with XRE-family HTH domain